MALGWVQGLDAYLVFLHGANCPSRLLAAQYRVWMSTTLFLVGSSSR